MPARWIEQKKLKMVRMRRAWAKPLERKSGIRPNRIVINEYKERAKGLAIDEKEADKTAAALLGEREGFKGVPPGKVEALKRQGELEAILDDATFRIRGPGPSNHYQESFIYFNSKKTVWRVLHRDLRRKVESLSIVYTTQEALRLRWEMDKITWIEYRPIVPA